MASYGFINIKSNDGSQTLKHWMSGSNTPTISVTSTGVTDNSNTYSYTYSGDKTFLGLATSPNATEPTYAVGNNYTLSLTSGISLYLYIVEADKTPTLTYDLSQLDLAAGTHSITVRAKADGYADSEPSNAVEYVVEESVPGNLKGYTVTVPANWSADANSWMDFNLCGSLNSISFADSESNFRIAGDEESAFGVNDSVVMLNSDFIPRAFTPSTALTFIITGGVDVANSSLIQWLADNNATFEKTATTPTLISFTIDGTSYTAEEGMTWADWCASDYNTGGASDMGYTIYASNGKPLFEQEGCTAEYQSSDLLVINTETIIANHDYYSMSGNF